MAISQAPLSTPISSNGSTNTSWLRWFTRLAEFVTGITTIRTATSLSDSQQLTYVYGRPLLLYSYTGQVGGTWNIEGNLVVIASTVGTTQTTKSFLLVTGE
jgi:hypothetical protein